MRQDFAYGKFFKLAFAVGLPIKLLGVFIPALAFLKCSLATGLIVGVFIMFSMRFKQIEHEPSRPSLRNILTQPTVKMLRFLSS
ncbi:hypothetical protein [Azonexus sp. R2A61]|uniref:hypothetical protein n=1 Tax=Azonexus sp. R2A61 TaxID=2744443 RepID=UPI001F1A1731|nr:hypothetical protein [Azonexus sp. R2A61]